VSAFFDGGAVTEAALETDNGIDTEARRETATTDLINRISVPCKCGETKSMVL
jgi:hypothetical protein